MKKSFPPRRSGQMAISMVISILLFLLLMFPVMDLFVQNEGKWSVKEKKSTTAFHLAEAGVDRARWKLLESDDMWIMTGTGTIAGYNFDQVYTAESGGTYAVKISSHPTEYDKRVVESVGKDRTGAQLRRIKAILRNDNAADFATRAANMVANTGGNDHIEWGPVISGNSIDATGRTFPRFYSAGHVTPQDGGSTSASTDNVYWWSYYEIPKFPKIKFSTYLSSAQASGAAPNGCGNDNASKYYHVGNAEFKGCHDESWKTYYITGDATFKDGGGGNFIRGTMIILGNIIISGGGGGDGAYQAKLPPEAWKEYGHNAATWAHYKVFDPGGPASYAAAEAGSGYKATGVTYGLTNVLLHGFMYTGGSQGLQGGGNCNLNGVLLSNQDATMGTSSMRIYYNDGVAKDILIQGVNIKLDSWYEVKAEWPSGL
jgi:hypothetical protein